MSTAPRKLRRTTLAGDAHAAVRDLLLGGTRYAPGEKISIEELARDLGVSRSPIWTAVARLEAEGIVEVSPRQGVFLVGFAPERVRAVFEAREALEGMAARLAARRMSDAALAELAGTVARQTAALERKSRTAYDKANSDFHEALLAGCENPAITKALRSLYAQTQAMCGKRTATFEQLAGNRDEHAAILKALEAHDEEAAEHTARAHVAQRLTKLLPDGPCTY
ncbi:GntR family transcriptional regulator [Paraburkholderia saeva]|uniref:GntR family transcriptional regulator n=1 Tax=Paraburkholderia saeva TaxID=2777537 RepID=UPI001D6D778B|nr:GntR family transcriptional regulator [Paraburkholderia saeva]CAG4892988.1 putative D-xylose utilization operon transcriptional repressor [Paraburkholderia saeva]